MSDNHQLITPEPINEDNDRYLPGTWDYPTRCANIELAMVVTRERVEEWDPADADGWWHQRPLLIALHNEVVRLRADLADMTRQRDDYRSSFEASDRDNDRWRAEVIRLQADSESDG